MLCYSNGTDKNATIIRLLRVHKPGIILRQHLNNKREHTVAFSGNSNVIHIARGRHKLVIVDAVFASRISVANSNTRLTVLLLTSCIQ